jgi:hypothetical protein
LNIDVIHLIDYNLYIMGAAHCGLGDLQTGEDYLMQALQNTLQTGKTDHLMNILFSFAQLLLKESEAAGDEDTSLKKQTQAFALLSLVVDNPFTWQVYRDKASHLRDEQVALLPEAVRTAVTTPALPQEWPQDGQQFIDEIIRSV